MNRMTKKAALGYPSSDETFPLREKPIYKAAASYPGWFYDLHIKYWSSSLAPLYDGMISTIDSA